MHASRTYTDAGEIASKAHASKPQKEKAELRYQPADSLNAPTVIRLATAGGALLAHRVSDGSRDVCYLSVLAVLCREPLPDKLDIETG